jgi:hypothetical protein
MEEIDCQEDKKAAFQGVALQGDRIAILITGSSASRTVRLELRTSSIDLFKNFTSQTEVIQN